MIIQLRASVRIRQCPIITVAVPLCAGRITMLFSFISSASACLSFFVMFGFGNCTEFRIPVIYALN